VFCLDACKSVNDAGVMLSHRLYVFEFECSYDDYAVSGLMSEWQTRKLCNRKDDRAMRLVYECPESF